MKKETLEKYTVVYTYETDATHVDFKVYEITGHSAYKNGKYTVPFYEKKGDMTKDVYETEEAETFITGFVKWDGCSHYYFGDKQGYLHLCGDFSIAGICMIIKHVYIECGKILKEAGHILDGEFEIK